MVEEQTSVVFSHPVGGALLGKPKETKSQESDAFQIWK
jgi:hypothetical protein